MAIDEQTRYEIYESFRDSYGERVANGLMELLPPVGWADVATKHDLAALEERIDLRFEVVDRELAMLRNTIESGLAVMDAKFEGLDAKFEARLERALRRQSTKFVSWMFAGFMLFGIAERLFP